MRVELHCHSNHSDGVPSIRDIVEKANRTLGALAITDHNTQSGYLEARGLARNFILIPAVEITCTLGDRRGHMLALGVEEFKRGDVFEVMDAVKSQGGVTILAHPFRGLGYSFHQKDVWQRANAIEVLNGNTLAYKNHQAFSLARDLKKPMTSGSDAHWLHAVGSYACEIDADSVDGILQAIRRGNVTIPVKSTNALRILFYGTVRKSKRKLRKVLGKNAQPVQSRVRKD